MSGAYKAILEAAGRDLYRYQNHALGELSPEVRKRCSTVIRALSLLVHSIQSEERAREGGST